MTGVLGDSRTHRVVYQLLALFNLVGGVASLAGRQWAIGGVELAFALAWASFEAVRRQAFLIGYRRGRLEVLDHLQRTLPDTLEDVLEHQLQVLGAEMDDYDGAGGDDAPP